MPTKVCRQCRVEKPVSEFHRRLDGYQPRCKACVSEYQKSRYAADPERFKAAEESRRRARGVPKRRKGLDVERAKRTNKSGTLKRLYGITLDDFERMLESQGGVCAICKTDAPNGHGWHVDHDHETGRVRGILCHDCNTGIGSLKDDPALLHKAADYLLSDW